MLRVLSKNAIVMSLPGTELPHFCPFMHIVYRLNQGKIIFLFKSYFPNTLFPCPFSAKPYPCLFILLLSHLGHGTWKWGKSFEHQGSLRLLMNKSMIQLALSNTLAGVIAYQFMQVTVKQFTRQCYNNFQSIAFCWKLFPVPIISLQNFQNICRLGNVQISCDTQGGCSNCQSAAKWWGGVPKRHLGCKNAIWCVIWLERLPCSR